MGALTRFYRVTAEDSHRSIRKVYVALNFGGDLQVMTDRTDREIEISSVQEPRNASTLNIRLINYLQRAGQAVVLCIFIYGVVMYPDAPIKPCGEAAYCGKGGKPRSEVEFRAYKRWETTLIVTALIGVSSHFFLNRYKKRKRS
jgi:hypothetical protein